MSKSFHGQGSGRGSGSFGHRPYKPPSTITPALSALDWRRKWDAILTYLSSGEVGDVHKSICVSCGHGKLYDQKGGVHQVNGRYMDVDEVKALVQRIRDINIKTIHSNEK